MTRHSIGHRSVARSGAQLRSRPNQCNLWGCALRLGIFVEARRGASPRARRHSAGDRDDTNVIEALNSKLRRAVRARGHFPSDEAATKLLFLVLNRAEKEWIMPPREWSMAKAQFAVLFGERFTRAMA